MSLQTVMKARLQFQLALRNENWKEVISTGSAFLSK